MAMADRFSVPPVSGFHLPWLRATRRVNYLSANHCTEVVRPEILTRYPHHATFFAIARSSSPAVTFRTLSSPV